MKLGRYRKMTFRTFRQHCKHGTYLLRDRYSAENKGIYCSHDGGYGCEEKLCSLWRRISRCV